MELISRTWHQLPDSVRKNTCNYYIPLVNDCKIKSVVDGIVTDYGTSRGERGSDGFTTMKFTEKQWDWFLLKWS